jgi:uncharacterized protein YtpQ (UPF0354 family)
VRIAILTALLPPVQGKLLVMSLHAGGIFEASLFLFDRVWDKRELGIEGEIVVAVPSREVLLVTDEGNPVGMTRIAKMATDIASKSGYSITDRLFIRRDGAFVPLWRGAFDLPLVISSTPILKHSLDHNHD